MKRLSLLFATISFTSICLFGQELYPLSEPASNIPAQTIGVKLYGDTYKEVIQWRYQTNLRLMYGITPRLTTYLTFAGSNHHGDKLPSGFPYHNSPERGAIYPYKFNGANLYFKYRFLTIDKEKEHFRAAAYFEGSWAKTTHHESEPNVRMIDNSGVSGGIIVTYLKNKFAASLTLGYTHPIGFEGVAPDDYVGLPDIPQYVQFGPSIDYHLSFGYLLLPKTYTSFDQTNFNIYLEFHGKKYDPAIVKIFYGQDNAYWLENNLYPVGLQAGQYIDISPGVQVILKSNTRIDFSLTTPLIGQSYARLYPVYSIGFQRYFFK